MASLTPWAPPHDPRRPPPPQRPLLGAIPSPSPCSSPTPWGDAAPLAHARRGGGGHGGDILVGGGTLPGQMMASSKVTLLARTSSRACCRRRLWKLRAWGGEESRARRGGDTPVRGLRGAKISQGRCVYGRGGPVAPWGCGGCPPSPWVQGGGCWVLRVGALPGGHTASGGAPCVPCPKTETPLGWWGTHTRPHGARLPTGGGGPGWGGPQALPGSCAPPPSTHHRAQSLFPRLKPARLKSSKPRGAGVNPPPAEKKRGGVREEGLGGTPKLAAVWGGLALRPSTPTGVCRGKKRGCRMSMGYSWGPPCRYWGPQDTM